MIVEFLLCVNYLYKYSVKKNKTKYFTLCFQFLFGINTRKQVNFIQKNLNNL